MESDEETLEFEIELLASSGSSSCVSLVSRTSSVSADEAPTSSEPEADKVEAEESSQCEALAANNDQSTGAQEALETAPEPTIQPALGNELQQASQLGDPLDRVTIDQSNVQFQCSRLDQTGGEERASDEQSSSNDERQSMQPFGSDQGPLNDYKLISDKILEQNLELLAEEIVRDLDELVGEQSEPLELSTKKAQSQSDTAEPELMGESCGSLETTHTNQTAGNESTQVAHSPNEWPKSAEVSQSFASNEQPAVIQLCHLISEDLTGQQQQQQQPQSQELSMTESCTWIQPCDSQASSVHHSPPTEHQEKLEKKQVEIGQKEDEKEQEEHGELEPQPTAEAEFNEEEEILLQQDEDSAEIYLARLIREALFLLREPECELVHKCEPQLVQEVSLPLATSSPNLVIVDEEVRDQLIGCLAVHQLNPDWELELEFDQEPAFEPREVTVKRGQDPRQQYTLCDEIGRGQFGTVYRCVEVSTGKQLAAKFVHVRRKEDRQDVEREVAIMSRLQHKRLLQLYDAFDDGRNELCLVTELVEGGELFERIVDDDFELTERKAAIFMRQICEGVEYMQTKRIVHLDMKPENILCVSRTGNRIKLIDFGLARSLDSEQALRVMFGTPDFAAPEVLAYDVVSLATDMWSVGVICYVLLSGLMPFMGDTDMETMANVTRASYDFDAEAFEPISDLAKDFIAKLLVKEQEKRLSPRECLDHPWLQRGGVQLAASLSNSRRNSAVASITIGHYDDNMMATVSPEERSPAMGATPPLAVLDKRNLKKYVVRRKWHKTVHAIMALGRMGANLKRLVS